MRKKPDYRKLMIALIIVCVITISIGFSAAQDNLTINRMTAMVRAPKEISITNLSFIGSNSGGTSTNEYYSSNNIISTISLPNADSTITYDIDITNAGENIKGTSNPIEGTIDNQETDTHTLSGSEVIDTSHIIQLCLKQIRKDIWYGREYTKITKR